MPVSGRKPKEGPKRNRNAPTHDWVEVDDVPFEGPSPDLPEGVAWHPQTLAWYEVVRQLPHAVLWTEGEWQEIATTALLHTEVWNGATARAPELRQREKSLGLTADYRRDLRIRYVPRTNETPAVSKMPGTERPNVVHLPRVVLTGDDDALDA